MFSQKQKFEYNNTHAPVGLKDRILDSVNERKSFRHRYARRSFSRILVAAILAITALSVTFAMSRPGGSTLYYDGQKISYDSLYIRSHEAVPAAFSTRRSLGSGIELEIRSNGEFAVAASDGEFCVFDSESGEILFCGGTVTGHGNTKITWNVDLSQKNSFSLTVTQGDKVEHYVLDTDPDQNSYTISRKAV